MLFGFDTENETVAAGCLLVYAVYKSRDVKRGPSGYDMWEQIERFTRRAAMRADEIGEFLESFKRQMACGTINPKWCSTGVVAMNAMQFADGSIFVHGDNGSDDAPRDFMISIIEASADKQQEIMDTLYEQSQRVILLVRDRLEREKPLDGRFADVTEED